MAEKDYTKYEGEMRDFEKKPLAKDRETLIFPPESDIKESDKQNASVLPAAPKLSMRKEASRWTRLSQTDEQEESISVVEKAVKIAEHSIVGGTTIGKEPQTVILDLTHQGGEIYIYSEGEINVFGEDMTAYDEESIAEVIRSEMEGKTASKKFAVGDKILTSSKKKVKVVHLSADLVFWVSIDGEKDFGSDFVGDVEPFEEHEPFKRHRRERGEPFDKGITKEIPIDLEEI